MSVGVGAASSELYFVLAMLGVAAMLFTKNRKAMALALAIALIAVPVLKSTMGEERPCFGILSCPLDNGMPSGHATVAFIFAAGSLGSPAFWFFYPAAILVSLSRVIWGAHTIMQIATGAAFGVALFFCSKQLLQALGEIRGERIHWRAKRFVKRKLSKKVSRK